MEDEWERSEKTESAREMHIITRLVWEIRSAPTSFFFLPWTTLLPSVCIGRKETDEGFTVGSWHVHIPGVVFLPSAPWPYQRPLKQQAVRLWQLASNSSYSSLAPRFPASPSSWAIVCLCVCMFLCVRINVCLNVCVCRWVVKCLFGLYMWMYSSFLCRYLRVYLFEISRTSLAET